MDVGRVLIQVGIASAAVFTLLSSAGPLTGHVTHDRSSAVSIENSTTLEVSRLAFDDVITRGETTSISVELTNAGSNTLEAVNFTVEVFPENGTVWSYPSREASLPPGTFFSQEFNHTPQEAGLHTVRLRIRLDDRTALTVAPLRVRERPEDFPAAQNGTVTLVRKILKFEEAPEEPEPAPPSRSWEVDAPSEVTVPEGGSATTAISVTNTGDATLRNVRLLLNLPENVTADYSPKILFQLRPDTTKNFMLSLDATNGSTGTHQVAFTASSDQLSRDGSIDITVQPTATIKQLQQETRSIRLMMADAQAQKRVAAERGFDVEPIDEALNRSERSLSEASEALQRENVRQAEESIGAARSAIEQAYTELFHIRESRVSVRAPVINPVYVLLVVSVLAGIVLVAGYYYLRKRQTERPALLREE